MNALSVKENLLHTIKQANEQQLNDIYDIVNNYLHKKSLSYEWDNLSEHQKQHLNQSVKQADENKTIPFDVILNQLKVKYGFK